MILMKIAMFTDTYEPQVNGVVISIKRFTKELKKRGHEVYIFSPRSEENEAKDFIHSFRSIAFRKYPEYKIALPIIKGCPKEFDVIHVHSPFTMGMVGIAMGKYYDIPVVGTFHTKISDYLHYLIRRDKIRNIKQVKKLAKKFTWKYCSFFYNLCDRIIAPSEEMKATLEKHKIRFRKEIAVIPTGIEITKSRTSRAKLRKKYGFSEKNKVILHVGRLTKEKNIKTVIKAVSRLNRNIKTVITSDGPIREELEKYASSLGMKDSIIFTGYISKKVLWDYYKLADLFVMASKTETQGIVLAEAAANKLPAVVLDAEVTGGFVRKNKTGIVAKEKELSGKIKTMLNSKARKACMNNCIKASEEYDIKKCTDDLVKVYSDIIESKKRN